MPHFIVEYANNLPDEVLAVDALLNTLCQTAVATGLFPETGLRARAYRADCQRVAGGDPNTGFVHVSMSVGQGRELQARQSAGEAIFDALKTHMKPLMAERKILLSFEMREIDSVKFNFKNI
mgnify:CR=1 FL=1